VALQVSKCPRGCSAAGAAIASAIDDAVGVPGAVTALPVTPQRMLALLRLAPRSDRAAR
jgi:carbon-monoxide dehydrogenase large subunit/6-hydroxypseudooxynicotine dehydrogenase subunit gamma